MNKELITKLLFLLRACEDDDARLFRNQWCLLSTEEQHSMRILICKLHEGIHIFSGGIRLHTDN